MATPIDFDALIKDCPVALDMTTETPVDTIGALVDALVAAGKLPPEARDEAFGAVWQREQTSSTAIANGIAIPHGYTDSAPGMTVAIGIHREGIEFGAMDGQPSRVFVMVINSSQSATGHISFLVALNRRLLDSSVRERLFLAKSREEVIGLICPQA